MDIFLDKRAVKQIRLSATDAIEEGDSETLREDVFEAFTDEQIEEIERRIDSGDFYDFIAEILDEWSGDEVDELFELLESHLSEAGIDLKFTAGEDEDEEEVEVEEEEEDEAGEPDDEDLDIIDGEGGGEEDEEL